MHGISSPPACVILIWPIHTDTTMKSHDDMCQVHMNSNNDMILLPAMTAGTVESLYNVCYIDGTCQKPNVKVKVMLF